MTKILKTKRVANIRTGSKTKTKTNRIKCAYVSGWWHLTIASGDLSNMDVIVVKNRSLDAALMEAEEKGYIQIDFIKLQAI